MMGFAPYPELAPLVGRESCRKVDSELSLAIANDRRNDDDRPAEEGDGLCERTAPRAKSY
jgi:hypothetical protein